MLYRINLIFNFTMAIIYFNSQYTLKSPGFLRGFHAYVISIFFNGVGGGSRFFLGNEISNTPSWNEELI